MAETAITETGIARVNIKQISESIVHFQKQLKRGRFSGNQCPRRCQMTIDGLKARLREEEMKLEKNKG